MTKAQENKPNQDSQIEISRSQLEVYATELQLHVREQRGVREELQRTNGQLEQRLMEITSLNRLFQDHLTERSSLFEMYRSILERLERHAAEAWDLSEFAKGNLTSDVFPVPSWEPVNGIHEVRRAA